MGIGFGGRRDFTTIYWLEDGAWKHRRHDEFQAPAREQIEALLGGPAPAWVPVREDRRKPE